MRFRDALKWSLKYHSVAVFPTLLGVGIVVAAVYLGAIEPVLPVLQSGSPSLDTVAAVATSVNAPLLFGGIALGLFTRRVGRTAMLVRTQSQAIDAKLADYEPTGSTGGTSGSDADSDFGAADGAGAYDDSFTNSGGETTAEATRTTGLTGADGDNDFADGSAGDRATGK